MKPTDEEVEELRSTLARGRPAAFLLNDLLLNAIWCPCGVGEEKGFSGVYVHLVPAQELQQLRRLQQQQQQHTAQQQRSKRQ